MSSKVVEADAGVHTLSMAVAVSSIFLLTVFFLLTVCMVSFQPVTSWRLYGAQCCMNRR